jgi:hypothetical protein
MVLLLFPLGDTREETLAGVFDLSASEPPRVIPAFTQLDEQAAAG